MSDKGKKQNNPLSEPVNKMSEPVSLLNRPKLLGLVAFIILSLLFTLLIFQRYQLAKEASEKQAYKIIQEAKEKLKKT